MRGGSGTDPDLISRLESILAAARSGEITGVCGIYVRRDGEVQYLVAGSAYAEPSTTLVLLDKLIDKVKGLMVW